MKDARVTDRRSIKLRSVTNCNAALTDPPSPFGPLTVVAVELPSITPFLLPSYDEAESFANRLRYVEAKNFNVAPIVSKGFESRE